MLYRVRRIFRRLVEGRPFLDENARSLRFIGLTVIVGELAWTGVQYLGQRAVAATLSSAELSSAWHVTFRSCWALWGTVSAWLGLFDLLWITGDDNRQALRDKLARTYVVSASAQPAGRGPIVYEIHYVFGWTFLLPAVRRTS